MIKEKDPTSETKNIFLILPLFIMAIFNLCLADCCLGGVVFPSFCFRLFSFVFSFPSSSSSPASSFLSLDVICAAWNVFLSMGRARNFRISWGCQTFHHHSERQHQWNSYTMSLFTPTSFCSFSRCFSSKMPFLSGTLNGLCCFCFVFLFGSSKNKQRTNKVLFSMLNYVLWLLISQCYLVYGTEQAVLPPC